MLLAVAGVQLLELREQARQVRGCNADARVFHLDPEVVGALPHHAHRDTPARGGELDGVGQVVVEHLLEPCRVQVHVFEAGVDLRRDDDVLAAGGRVQDGLHLLQHHRQIDGFGRELEFPRLHLRQVEHVVDQLQQVTAAGADVSEKLLVLG